MCGSVTPNTTRMITSRVSAFIRSSARDFGVGVPLVDLGASEACDEFAVATQRCAVERRHEQAPGAGVLVFIGEQHRVLTHDRSEDLVAFAGVQIARVGGEDFFDVFGPVEHHEVVGVGRNSKRKDVTVATGHGRKKSRAVALEQHALHGPAIAAPADMAIPSDASLGPGRPRHVNICFIQTFVYQVR